MPLIWTPAFEALEKRQASGDCFRLLIAPFIKLEALERLIPYDSTPSGLQVIVRWRASDLIAGVSDIEVFPYLKAARCQLFVNSDIHLKLYVFESNTAFNTSANLTLRGLGYSEPSNVEVGNMVNLTSEDWAKIHRVLLASRQVDDTVYQRAKAFVESNPKPGPSWAEPNFFDKPKVFTIGELPATATPAQLVSFYFATESKEYTPEDVRRATHDLVTFGIPPGLTEHQFHQRLGDAFRNAPFVIAFVAFLKSQGSLRFGAVNDWLHQKCEDVPLPYRWQIKENTAIFYNWLSHYIPEITWKRPRHSQVIYWGSHDG